jgi:hypothetical protein
LDWLSSLILDTLLFLSSFSQVCLSLVWFAYHTSFLLVSPNQLDLIVVLISNSLSHSLSVCECDL